MGVDGWVGVFMPIYVHLCECMCLEVCIHMCNECTEARDKIRFLSQLLSSWCFVTRSITEPRDMDLFRRAINPQGPYLCLTILRLQAHCCIGLFLVFETQSHYVVLDGLEFSL